MMSTASLPRAAEQQIANLETLPQELTPGQAEELQGGATQAMFAGGVLTVVGSLDSAPGGHVQAFSGRDGTF
jgi:hypothetical protein